MTKVVNVINKLFVKTFNERAEWERKEALRTARFEAFVRRHRQSQEAAQARGEQVCDVRLKERKVPQLEFSI